ncbi:MAG TPA: acyltransferase [Puia sp.]|nr:acyltransferase [Puia sp.]
MSGTTPYKKLYYTNLDTIRCFAAFFVVVYHWFPGKMTDSPLAKIGVDVFFVLSGFLISEILFKARDEAGDNPLLKGRAIGVFYMKRALRIFPIYYLLVSFFFWMNQPPLGGNWTYVFTYTTNFLIYWKQAWIYPLSHLWSLGVEEQFYIVWPFFIFFLPNKRLLQLIVFVLAVSVLFILIDEPRNPFFFVLPFSCMTTLGAGALLAYIKLRRGEAFRKFARYTLPVTVAAAASLVFWKRFNFITLHLVVAVMAFSLIWYAITSRSRVFNTVFSNPVTSYLGKISYGIYLYHHPIPWLVRSLNGTETAVVRHLPVFLPAFRNGYAILAENLAVLLIVASLSWFLIEKPLNSLKARLGKRDQAGLSLAATPPGSIR